MKGTVSKFFVSGFFHESSSPKPPKITIGSFRLENLRRYLQVKGTTGINDTGGKCAVSVNYTGGMTKAANLPPVSTTPAANFATGTAGFLDDVVSTMFQKNNGILKGMGETDS